MLLARELPGIDVPEGFLPVDMGLAREMIEKAAFLGFAVCYQLHIPIRYFLLIILLSVLNSRWGLPMSSAS